MTIWNPEIAQRSGPTYRAIADALAEDIETGDLRPGDRLPTHRDLAARVGVTLTTVTRAYAEAERRGLTEGTVGRGTFVSARKLERQAKGAMDLRVNALFPHTFGDELKAIMARIAGSASAVVMASSSAMSTCWPSPVSSRLRSARRMPFMAYNPAR